jgi:hypothetical protein
MPAAKIKPIVRKYECPRKAKPAVRIHDYDHRRSQRDWENGYEPSARQIATTRRIAMSRYRLDPVFDRTPDGAIKGIIRYEIYLDGLYVGSRRTHAQCHDHLDQLMSPIRQPSQAHRSTPLAC